MMHDDLLDIAEQLARLDSGRPRQASLRRAVSSAYYALFHALAALCANQFVGWKQPWDVFTPIYRSLDHGRAKELFSGWGRKHGGEIALIGQVFIKLQEQRHIADYDPKPFLGRAETLSLIDEVRKALDHIASLSPEDRLRLCTQLVARK